MKEIFSIVIPAHNEEKFISRCLQSVSILNDSDQIKEVIVVNNASTDQTGDMVKRDFPRVKLINEPRKGLTIAYNRGAKAAKGDILVFIDADSILPPNHLSKIIKALEQDPNIIAVSGPYVYKDGGLFCAIVTRFAYTFIVTPADFILNRLLKISAFIASGNLAIRKKAFDQVGGFNENIFYGLEADFTQRIRKIGKVRFIHNISVESSARRFMIEGTLRMMLRYSINIIWPVLFGKPFTRKYIDVR